MLFFAAPALAGGPERDYWPTQGWQTSPPSAEGMDPQLLLKVIPFIIEKKLDIRSLLVVRHGYIVFENYYGLGMPDKPQTVHSVTKSFTSALVGIARAQGHLIDLNAKLPDLLPSYFKDGAHPDKRDISLRDLLTMTAGMENVRVQNRNLITRWFHAPDSVAFTLDLPMVNPPGKVFAYCNAVSHLLSVILTKATGQNLWDLGHEYLFDPLGIEPKFWRQDSQGYYTGNGGLWLTPRQMAKFGFLYLNQGWWDGEQIVPAEWVEESTSAQVKVDERYDYGYQWWVRPVGGHPSYRAWGHGGQFITVVPDLDLVIAVTSNPEIPGKPSGNYSPLFDIIAQAVTD